MEDSIEFLAERSRTAQPSRFAAPIDVGASDTEKANRWLLPAAGVALILTALAVACGGGNDSPTSPTPPPTGGPPPANSLTLTITANGLSAGGEVAVGGTVTIVNSASTVHEMSSDPHPVHTDCPGLNLGTLQPGQQRTSQPLTSARTCGMHDHINPGTASLTRSIVIR
jgi:hypothetical protein